MQVPGLQAQRQELALTPPREPLVPTTAVARPTLPMTPAPCFRNWILTAMVTSVGKSSAQAVPIYKEQGQVPLEQALQAQEQEHRALGRAVPALLIREPVRERELPPQEVQLQELLPNNTD